MQCNADLGMAHSRNLKERDLGLLIEDARSAEDDDDDEIDDDTPHVTSLPTPIS